MADIKQIKWKIQATDNIKKITNALEIISTIKLQKIKHTTVHIRNCMVELIDIISSVDEKQTIFINNTTNAQKTLVVAIWSEKWLCGSLNTTLFKKIHTTFEHQKETTDIYIVGKKAKEYFSRRDYTIVAETFLWENISVTSHQDILAYIDTARASWTYKDIYVCYNVFKNTMKYIPIIFSLLPLSQTHLTSFLNEMEHEHLTINKNISKKPIHLNQLLIEPSLQVIQKKLHSMMMYYILYGSILQNKTCEFSARMLAMKWAKDNATTQIWNLKLSYNKARQDGITKEIIEIAGAKAIVAG